MIFYPIIATNILLLLVAFLIGIFNSDIMVVVLSIHSLLLVAALIAIYNQSIVHHRDLFSEISDINTMLDEIFPKFDEEEETYDLCDKYLDIKTEIIRLEINDNADTNKTIVDLRLKLDDIWDKLSEEERYWIEELDADWWKR